MLVPPVSLALSRSGSESESKPCGTRTCGSIDPDPDSDMDANKPQQQSRPGYPGGVCFDMDGTLIDSEPIWTRAIVSCCAAAGLVLAPDLLDACAGLATADGIRLVLRRNPGRDVDPVRLGEAIKDEVGERLRREPPVMPGADALLRELHRRGVPMALVSSSPRALIRSVLDGLAWEPLFRLSLSTEEVGPSKPDPAVYAEALRRLDANPAAGWAVEDTLAGLRSARGAGLRVVAIPSYPHESQAIREAADATFDSLAEAAPWLLAQFPKVSTTGPRIPPPPARPR